jgi:hypothetical protein
VTRENGRDIVAGQVKEALRASAGGTMIEKVDHFISIKGAHHGLASMEIDGHHDLLFLPLPH